jgi:hypothetical protein
MTSAIVPPITEQAPARNVLIVAWAAMLLSSSLPAILFFELGSGIPAWLLPLQLALLAALLVLTWAWPVVRPLRPLALILITILGGAWLIGQSGIEPRLARLLAGRTGPFTANFLSEQGGRLALTLLMIAVLWLIYRDRRRFFLNSGDLQATAAPIRWIGHTDPAPWSRLGPIAGVLISLGTASFVWLAGQPSLEQMATALPLLPAVLLVAALNAFNETITYRASFLATLELPAGAAQALLMAAIWFGVGHYFGVPYGIIGVVMSTFLGWFLGRSLLETRGSFWAWFIHFLQDVVIFYFIALGAVTPGGR